MTTAKRVIKNTGFLYAKMGITIVVSLCITRLILNSLGISDFGIFNIVGGAIAMLGFLNAAMASATQRFMSFAEGEGDTQKLKKIFNISFVLHLFIALIVGLVLLFIGYFFFNGILRIATNRIFAAKIVYLSLIISTIFTIMTVPYDAVLNANENMLYYSIVGVVESFLKLLVAFVILNYKGDKLIIYGILMAAIPLITMSFMRIYCHKYYEECKLSPFQYWDKSLMKEMTGFAAWNFWGTSVGMISNYGQGIVINIFFGTIVNAAQGVANQIGGQLSSFSTTMLKAINPIIVKREGSGNRKKMIEISMTATKLAFALLAFFAVPVIIEMKYVLHVWLKNVPDYAEIFCILLLVRLLIEQLFTTLSTSISATGNIKNFQITLSILALLPLFISYIFFIYGFRPWILYVVYIFHVLIRSFGIILFYAKKLCDLPVKYFLINVICKNIIVLFVTLLIALIPYYLLQQGFIRFIIRAVVFSISFLILFYFISLNKKEKQIINLLLERLLKLIIK